MDSQGDVETDQNLGMSSQICAPLLDMTLAYPSDLINFVD